MNFSYRMLPAVQGSAYPVRYEAGNETRPIRLEGDQNPLNQPNWPSTYLAVSSSLGLWKICSVVPYSTISPRYMNAV